MVNRDRSETWTSGVKNNQSSQRLHLSKSESNLENLEAYFKQSNESLNFDPICLTSENKTSNWKKTEYERQISNRPVYSTSSMESVDLSAKGSSFDFGSVSSINFVSSFEDQEQHHGDTVTEVRQQDKVLTPTLKINNEKSALGSFFSWISSSRNQSKEKESSKHSLGVQKQSFNSSQSLEHEAKTDEFFRRSALRRSSVSLDRGMMGLKSLKQSMKFFGSNSSSIRHNHSFDPISTSALILEDRPSNLPSKSSKEIENHQLQYNKILQNAKKQEKRDSLKREKLIKDQQKLEKTIVSSSLVWSNEIVPNWNTVYQTSRVQNLWWQGLPPSVRGMVWKLAIGNDLNITEDLYDIMVIRSHDKLRSMDSEQKIADEMDSIAADRESTVELIRLDISRTFPQLCIFQKGGPYYDLLHDILGGYVCYRPDVGYVQGMSFMAATLLLNMEAVDAFIAFANIMNKPCQVAFYRLDENQIRVYFATFNVFFQENLPNLFDHFKKIRLTPDMYLIDWVFTIFTKALSLDVASRVWDLFCRDWEEFVFRTAIAILKLHEDILLRSDFIHSAQFLTRLPSVTHQQLFASISDVVMVSHGNRRWKDVLVVMRNVQ